MELKFYIDQQSLEDQKINKVIQVGNAGNISFRICKQADYLINLKFN
jgi:hypothetical protein